MDNTEKAGKTPCKICDKLPMVYGDSMVWHICGDAWYTVDLWLEKHGEKNTYSETDSLKTELAKANGLIKRLKNELRVKNKPTSMGM